MKSKILIIFVLGIFLLGFVSSADWDNKIKYSNEDLRVDFKNSFLGIIPTSSLGSIELKSHKSIDEILEVGAGENKTTMFYETNFREIYKNGFGEVIFIDMRTGEEVEKDYYFAELIIEQRIKYKDVCENKFYENGTKYSECSKVEDGYKEIEVWKKLENNDIPKGKITIGLITDVEVGDYIDAVWTIAGKKVKKHATWTASLNVDLEAYWTFGDASGTIFENISVRNLTTAGGVTYGVSGGPLGNAFGFGGLDGKATKSPFIDMDSWTEFSIAGWVYIDDFTTSFNYVLGVSEDSGNGLWALRLNESNGMQWGVGDGSAFPIAFDGNFPEDQWVHVVGTVEENDNLRLYVDGSEIGSGTAIGTFGNPGTFIGFGVNRFGTDNFLQGNVSDWGIWSRELTSAEVTQLHNGGSGIAYKDSFDPIITLNSPVDFFNTTDMTIIFNGSVTGITPINVTLFIDDVANETNATGILDHYIFTKIISDGEHTWNYEACVVVACVNGTARTFTINTKPQVNLSSPADNFNTTIKRVLLNSSVTTPNTNLLNVSLRINGGINQTNSSGIEGNYSFSNIYGEQNLNWSVEACNSGGCNVTENRTLIVHITAPTVSILDPIGTLDFIALGNTLNLNWSVVEEGTNLSEHITNCSYDYNGSTTFISISDCVDVNKTTFTYALDSNSLFFNVTDIFGLSAFDSTAFDFKFVEINNTFENETIEGNLENYFAFGKLGTGLTISEVNFVYNGSVETGDSFLIGDITVLRKPNFLVPDTQASANKTFFWNMTLSDSTNINLTTQSQTVSNISLDNCSTFTNEIINFTLVDEETQVQLPNVTIETANNLFSGDRSEVIVNFSKISFQNPTRICLNVNLTSNSNYSLDVVVRYETPTSAIEYYNIVGLELTDSTARQDIRLYDLNISDSTEFQLSFTGSDFLPVENALVNVDRQYISENTFKTVELPKTDFNGQAVLHLVRNDVVYNVRIIKDNVVLGNFENIVAFCDDFTIGDCNIELNAFDSVESIFNYDSSLGIIFNEPEFNESIDRITFNFLTTDGSVKTVILNTTRNDIFGNRTICETSLTSSGGTLVCDIDPNLDESVLKTEIYVNGVLAITSNVKLDSSNFGDAGYLIMFVMAMSLVLMFSNSKTGVLVAIGINTIGSVYLGLTSGDLIGAGASGLWLLIIVLVGIYKINAERSP